MSASATRRTKVGIAKEAVLGTAVPPTAFFKPNAAPTLTDNAAPIMDDGWRGAPVANYDTVPGPRDATYQFPGNVHPDTIGWCLAAVLGEVATTGASAPFTHTITALNSGNFQPPSYTITDDYGVATRQVAGAMASQVEIAWSATGGATFTSSWAGFGSITASEPAGTYSSIKPLAGWMASVTIAAAPVTKVLDGKVTIARTVDVIHGAGGSTDPTDVFGGQVQVTGSMTVVMQADDYYQDWTAGTQLGAIVIDFTTGAGAALVELKLTMSKCAIVSPPAIQRDANYVKLAFVYEGLANATDIGASGGYSPIKVLLQNAVAAGTYA